MSAIAPVGGGDAKYPAGGAGAATSLQMPVLPSRSDRAFVAVKEDVADEILKIDSSTLTAVYGIDFAKTPNYILHSKAMEIAKRRNCKSVIEAIETEAKEIALVAFWKNLIEFLVLPKELNRFSVSQIRAYLSKMREKWAQITCLEIVQDVPILPDELEYFKELVVLRVDCGLQKVPNVVNRLSNLQTLRLDHNEITEFPCELNCLEQLHELDLSHNKISVVPSSISAFQNLGYIDLSHNQIASMEPMHSQMPRLIEMNLGNNQLKELPLGLEKCLKCTFEIWQNPLDRLPDALDKKFARGQLIAYHNDNLKVPLSWVVERVKFELERINIRANYRIEDPKRPVSIKWANEKLSCELTRTAEGAF